MMESPEYFLNGKTHYRWI